MLTLRERWENLDAFHAKNVISMSCDKQNLTFLLLHYRNYQTTSLAFYLFSSTCLINSIKHDPLYYTVPWQIENTRWVSFDIKFTRQGFENACWHREACWAIQHAFSKPSLVTWYQKEWTWYSFYQFTHCFTLQTSDYDVIFNFLLNQCHRQRHSKSATSSWPDKGTCREIDNVYQATCNNAFNMQGNW